MGLHGRLAAAVVEVLGGQQQERQQEHAPHTRIHTHGHSDTYGSTPHTQTQGLGMDVDGQAAGAGGGMRAQPPAAGPRLGPSGRWFRWLCEQQHQQQQDSGLTVDTLDQLVPFVLVPPLPPPLVDEEDEEGQGGGMEVDESDGEAVGAGEGEGGGGGGAAGRRRELQEQELGPAWEVWLKALLAAVEWVDWAVGQG